MKSPTIEFINHASVIISYEEISILTDPWYNGTAFHDGWRLLYDIDDSRIIDILKKISHIYISHEHPDHFNVSFFLNKKIKEIIIKKKIEILFQKTDDKRVFTFLKEQGFLITELNSNQNIKINKNVEIQIIKFGFYDSCLIVKIPNLKILNLNDCPMRDLNEIENFKNKNGTFDVLLTQFSYAAWKGGIKNKNFREESALEKLKSIENQANILKCKSVIPFASFIYFSNELNFYMNDSINTPKTVINFFREKIFSTIILSPGEIQNLNGLKQNQNSINFWNEQYDNIALKKKDKYSQTISLDSLKIQFEKYKRNIFKKNSKFLILILSKIKIMNIFQSIKIKLLDHGKTYRYSIFKGLYEIDSTHEYDIKMHSQSLLFIFKNEFGFDTLTVNGCFESSKNGFLKSTNTLAIGSLNSMGLNLNFSLIFQFKIIYLFLKKLKNVLKKIK